MLISLGNLVDLANLSRADLAAAWTEVFGQEPRFCPNPELFRNGIAWQLQEQKERRLTPALRRRLNQLADSIESKPERRVPAGAKLRSGTTIVKEWRGANHIVMVVDKEFVYGGKRYRSLSEIAREITGTRWNGPAFFGLRPGTGRVAEVTHG